MYKSKTIIRVVRSEVCVICFRIWPKEAEKKSQNSMSCSFFKMAHLMYQERANTSTQYQRRNVFQGVQPWRYRFVEFFMQWAKTRKGLQCTTSVQIRSQADQRGLPSCHSPQRTAHTIILRRGKNCSARDEGIRLGEPNGTVCTDRLWCTRVITYRRIANISGQSSFWTKQHSSYFESNE